MPPFGSALHLLVAMCTCLALSSALSDTGTKSFSREIRDRVWLAEAERLTDDINAARVARDELRLRELFGGVFSRIAKRHGEPLHGQLWLHSSASIINGYTTEHHSVSTGLYRWRCKDVMERPMDHNVLIYLDSREGVLQVTLAETWREVEVYYEFFFSTFGRRGSRLPRFLDSIRLSCIPSTVTFVGSPSASISIFDLR
jgi:hypothetical protein